MKNLKNVFSLLLFSLLFLSTSVFGATSSVPEVSIEPATTEVDWGTSSVDLNLTVSPEANVSSITVEYHNDYTNINDNITIGVGINMVNLPISTANIPSGTILTITLNDVNSNDVNQSVGGIGSGTATITITNTKPTANDKTYFLCADDTPSLAGNIITGAGADTPFTIDSDPDADPIFLAEDNSTSDISIEEDGTFTYTPEATFYGGYSFDYTITDGDLNSTAATITIDVRRNTLLAEDDNLTFESRTNDKPYTGNVLKNDGSTTYTVTLDSNTSDGNVTMNPDGSFTYIPNNENVTLDSFTYSVSDSNCGYTDTATVTINIYDMCLDSTELPINPCSDGNPTTITPHIVGGNPQVYWFTLPDLNVTLDLNISNAIGGKELTYDFNDTCSNLFISGTNSYLAQKQSIDISRPYPPGDYYLGLDVATWGASTDLEISICYDINSSGGGGNIDAFTIGVNDEGIDYTNNQSVTTKLVNKPFGLRASYLGESGGVETYTYDGADTDPGSKPVDLPFILHLADEGCGRFDPPIVLGSKDVMKIEHGKDHVDLGNILNIDHASPIRNIIKGSVDLGAAFRASTELTCAKDTGKSSYCGLPSCLNSEDNIRALYPPAFFPKVLTCIIWDGTPGTYAPCDQTAYTGSCGGKKDGYTISPSIYNHDKGCFDCLQRELGGGDHCGDDFAIRPDRFDVNITTTDPLRIFKAGKGESLLFRAPDYLDRDPDSDHTLGSAEYNVTQGEYNLTLGSYTTSSGPTFYIDLNVSNNDDCQKKNLTIDPAVVFQDGIHLDNFSFNDIGDINMSIHEINGTEFAIVDVNDTPAVGEWVVGEINEEEVNIWIEGRFIEPYDANFTVIPDHFNIEANLTDHNTDSNFTYLHDINQYEDDDNYSMGSALTLDIKAMGEDDNITRNYTENCYAKDTNLSLVLGGTNITYPGAQPLEYFLYFNPVEHNSSIANSGEGNNSLPVPVANSIAITSLDINNTVASFPADPLDADGNGTTHIEYKLNFDRKMNLVVNPFKIILTDVNITDEDDVNGSAIETAGTISLDQNATMYYARTSSSQFFYDDVMGSSVQTPIMVNIYCDLTFAECLNIGIDTSAQTNVIDWWLSLGHNADIEDGNITLKVGTTDPSGEAATVTVTPTNVQITSGGIDPNVIVATTSSVRPLIVPIELVDGNDPTVIPPYTTPYTNTWLIYNEGSATEVPSPFYKVRFIGISDWAGQGDTGHVVESNASTKKNRRLGW